VKINGNGIAFCCFVLALTLLHLNGAKDDYGLWLVAVIWAAIGDFNQPPDRPAT
jgi:hypothetical protein